jgi:hypothetical protein
MSSRPRSNDSRTLQGVKQKNKQAAQESDGTPKGEIEKARKRLRREVLKAVPKELRASFDSFGEGLDLKFLTNFIGIEMMRLQRSLGVQESPDFRYTSAMYKYMELLRKLLLMQTGSEAFIPDRIEVELHTFGLEKEEDYTDVIEFE